MGKKQKKNRWLPVRRVIKAEVVESDEEFAKRIQGMESGPALTVAIVNHYHIAEDDLDELERRFEQLGCLESLETLRWFRGRGQTHPNETVGMAALRFAKEKDPSIDPFHVLSDE